MRPPPPLSELPRYPVTGGVAALAILVTLASLKFDIAPLTMNGPKFFSEPWRILTSILPHGGFLHIAFNVYWLWIFGTLLEKYLGPVRFAAFVILLAAASSTAEFAILSGGIGLSGVVYGLFGILWVFARKDPRFADAIDKNTILTFVIWFFLCIALTYAHVMLIANVAHGAGAITGILLGWLYLNRKSPALPAAALLVFLGLIAIGATIGRTTVNFSEGAGEEYANAGDNALEQKDPARAIALYNHARQFRKTSPRWDYNTGVAYSQLNEDREALKWFQLAAKREPGTDPYAQTAKRLEAYEALRSTTTSAPAATQDE